MPTKFVSVAAALYPLEADIQLRARWICYGPYSRIFQSYLNRIALRLNQRPRKTLGFETLADRLKVVLQ